MNFRLLPYPLNVYAQTLALEYGNAEHLHFGVFVAGNDETYPVAQWRAQELLQNLLIPAPSRVLEIGCGSGNLARALSAQGYTVTATTNGTAEAEALLAAGIAHVQVDFMRYLPPQRFDIVVLQQSAQYFDPVLLLARVKECLREGGQLLIADEFLLDDTWREHVPLPLREHFLQLATRCGFHSERQQELGPQVAPGLSLFHSLLLKHQEPLCSVLALDAQCIRQLADELLRIQQKLSDARLGYSLLDLRRGPIDAHEAEFGNNHGCTAAEIQPLFESSFNAPFDAGVWQWKYGEGRGRAVTARIDSQLVGHYGGAPRDILYFGKPDKAIQICDVMVMPEQRGFASRDTLFFKTAATFLEQHVGNAAEYLLGFGFPNKRVLQVATRLGLYSVTDSFVECRYPLATLSVAEWEIVDFDLASQSSQVQVNALWEQMAAGLRGQIVGVRDWRYLHYRYCTHPLWQSRSYRCVALRRKGSTDPAAVVVLKKHDNALLVMDIIGEVAMFPALLAELSGFVGKTDDTLVCRITKGQFARISVPGCEMRDLEIDIPCNSWTRGPKADELAGAWWLTAGDMDFL